MNRRAFFQRVLGGVAAATVAPLLELDPERALWVPGKKTIFLPPAPTIQTIAFHPDAFSMVMDDLTYQEFRDRYIRPAVADLARHIDVRIMEEHYPNMKLKDGSHVMGWRFITSERGVTGQLWGYK